MWLHDITSSKGLCQSNGVHTDFSEYFSSCVLVCEFTDVTTTTIQFSNWYAMENRQEQTKFIFQWWICKYRAVSEDQSMTTFCSSSTKWKHKLNKGGGVEGGNCSLLFMSVVWDNVSELWQEEVKWRTLRKTCPSVTLCITNSTWTDLGTNPGFQGDRPATTCLSHGTAQLQLQYNILPRQMRKL
jgi:hypothetical protein